SVGSDSRQPAFHRSATFKTLQLGKRFQERFLGSVFGQASLPKKSMRHVKYTWTVASNYFTKRSFILGARALRQFEIRSLFVTVRQKRPLIGFVSEPRAVTSGSRCAFLKEHQPSDKCRLERAIA